MERFVVAEISKSWIRGRPVNDGPLLCELFERVINRNLIRGYRLDTFSLHRFMVSSDEMNETIIAVFEVNLNDPETNGADGIS
jgi:hypothetical protein